MKLLGVLQRLRPIRLARVFGIPLDVHYSWFIIFILHLWAVSEFHLPMNAPGADRLDYWIFGTLTTILLFLSVLIHELSHSLVARAEGIGTRSITLYIFGGLSSLDREAEKPSSDFKIGVVGPASSFLLGFAFAALGQLFAHIYPSALVVRVFAYLSFVNLILAAFNLLPGFPLDGGRILRAYLWHKRGNLQLATRKAAVAGRNIVLLLMFSGLIYSIWVRDWFLALWSIFIGLFLAEFISRNYRQFLWGNLEAGIVADIMVPPNQVAPQMTLADFLDNVLPATRQETYPVVRDGRFHGILALKQIKEVPQQEWSRVRIADVMRPVDDTLFLLPQSSLASARAKLSQNGLGAAGVIDDNGYLVGYVSLKDIVA